jgi:hypothetical protein
MPSKLNTKIVNVFFNDSLLTIALNDGRIIIFPCHTIKWLIEARPDQQKDFEIETDGYGLWWNQLDDGIALHHVLTPSIVSSKMATTST